MLSFFLRFESELFEGDVLTFFVKWDFYFLSCLHVPLKDFYCQMSMYNDTITGSVLLEVEQS